MDKAQYVREDWVTASHFHDLTQTQVLNEVWRRASEAHTAHPLILFDLDSTLYEVAHRTWEILREWTRSEESKLHERVRRALTDLAVHHVGYSIRDTFSALGLSLDSPETQNAIQAVKPFWSSRFFTSQYLKYDRPYPGAAEFARKLFQLGTEIIYLTGRDEPGMGEGTRANLIRDEFPWEPGKTHVLLKSNSAIPDLEHKKAAAAFVRSRGKLIASFENEPPNLVALYEIFPEAMHVFLETVCSDHPAGACQNLYRIQGFEIV